MSSWLNRLQQSAQIWLLGITRIPLIAFVLPRAVEVTDKRCEIKIPLSYRTKNHLGSMYFGTLAIGTDLAGGLLAWRRIQASGHKISLVFKDLHAEFLKRVEGDCHFECEDGALVDALVERAIQSKERVEETVRVTATVPSKSGREPVAQFRLTLSLKA